METFEATRVVLSRVQSIDPENASKIMLYIMTHHTEKDMIRFAHGPETLIISIVSRAKADLGLLSETSCAPVISPISNPIAISRSSPRSLSLHSPRLANNGFNPSSPSLPSIWSNHHHSLSPNANHSLSYAAVVNGTCSATNGCFSSSIGSPQVGFNIVNNTNRENLVDESHLHEQNVSFINDPLAIPSKSVDFFDQTAMDLAISPGCRSDSALYPLWEHPNGPENHPHFYRRNSSFNETYFGTDESTSGFGFKPCLYYAKGFCKNGSTCKFVHGGVGFSDCGDNSGSIVGSSCKFDAFGQCPDELLRSKIAHQQRLAAHLMASGMNLPFNKLNVLQNEAQRSAAAALMMGEDFHKLNQVRMARNEFLRGDSNPGERQIYLTFPADSTFKEEDVSEYFSRFGPVQDVRIPYQQKRMFGFVTFVYPETVSMILSKGNPHFVCDSRVLVKPYKEKGKLPDKKQQQMERVEFSCSSPSGLECRDPVEFPLGGRMLHNAEEMLLKRKLEEQAGLQQALEFQSRRLMNLQILDLNNQQSQHNMSMVNVNQNDSLSSNGIRQDAAEENKGTLAEASDQQLAEEFNCDSDGNGILIPNKEDIPSNGECEFSERKFDEKATEGV